MLNIGLIVLISVDFLLLFIGKIIFYLHTFKVFSFRDFINKIQSSIPDKKRNEIPDNDIFNEYEPVAIKKESLWTKSINWIKNSILFILKFTGAILLVVIGFALGIGIPTSSIWGTVLIAIYVNVLYAVLFLFAMKLVNFFMGLWIFKVAKVDKNRTKRILIMDAIQFIMLSLFVFLAAFGYPFDVNKMITMPYEWNIVLNNVLSIVIPMLFYALVITNIFALFIRFKNIFTKDVNKHRVIRLHQLLFIFIASCFFGILYITDIDLSFMSEVERTMYLQTLEVIKWIVTSAFIPLFLYTLNNYKRTSIVKKPKFRRRSRPYHR